MSQNKNRRIGLRLYEVETAFASNLHPASPGLLHYRKTRLLGQAARLAQLIRGVDVIEDVDRLSAIAAAQLNIDPMHFDNVIDVLEELDLAERKGQRLLEKVRQIDFGENYERVGALWTVRASDEREKVAVAALDELVDCPRYARELAAFSSVAPELRDRVLEVAKNSHLVEPISVGAGEPILFAPMLWDISPERVQHALKELKTDNIMRIVEAMSTGPVGIELNRLPKAADQIRANRAVTVGLLPTYPVEGVSGQKQFTFLPYSGALVTEPAEREILDRARAIVSSVRYGQRYAQASKIRFPGALLRALLDPGRDYSLSAHTEIKDQYGPLVKRGIGNIFKSGSRYTFRLIPSEENKRAVRLALELVTHGEIVEERAPLADGPGALFAPGGIGTQFDGIKLAYERKRATDDELEDLVNVLRQP